MTGVTKAIRPMARRPVATCAWGCDHREVPGRPDGVVTFLLSDVVGSTRSWESEPLDATRRAIERMYELLDRAIVDGGGFRPAEQGEGDSVVGAFRSPSAAIAAAVRAQLVMHAEDWPTAEPIRVRMAVHTGRRPGAAGRRVAGRRSGRPGVGRGAGDHRSSGGGGRAARAGAGVAGGSTTVSISSTRWPTW